MKQSNFIIILLVAYQTSFALKPERKYAYRPENFGMIYKEFKVKTADNYKINTWFFPAQDTLPLGKYKYRSAAIKRDYTTLDNKKHPTIIICPADAGNMPPLTQYAIYMCPRGYNVVIFDWRGFGESDDFKISEDNLCYTEFFKDINAVIDSVKTLQEVDPNNIGIYGFSMSAFVSFPVFQQRKDLKCFIGRALSADFEVVKDFWMKGENKIVRLPNDYKKEYYPINVADKVHKPCFFITGELDKVTPPDRAQEIFSKLKGEKECWVVKNVGHGVEWDPSVGLKNYIERILQFCDKYLQGSSYRQEALKKFDEQDYNGGIEVLKKALKENPNDAELYCDLGHYYHYRAYDSRPLINYNRLYSDSIISFLDKAISIKPDYREPFYWLHIEHGARAINSLMNKNVKRYKLEYQTAVKKGAFPDWLIEYGRNTLSSCEPNAILFTFGDIPFNSTSFVQIIENYRKDVTIIPPVVERPGFVKLYKDGIKNAVTPVRIRFSDEQIMEIRPYKWDTLSLPIKIPENVRQKYKIENNYFKWKLAPDMTSEGSTYLNPWRAVFAEIIEANAFERPVYFADGFRTEALCGLFPFTINCGIVKKLVPFETKGTPFEIDNEVIEKVILNKENFKDFRDFESHSMEVNSPYNYYLALWHLANFYNKKGEKNKILMISDLLKGKLFSSSLNSDRYYNWINNIYK